jgi:hypothetical protein
MAVASDRRVLAGGEGLAGDEPVPRDLQELLIMIVGGVLKGQRRSMAGDDGRRRPWRRVIVPREGPANRGRGSVHELCGSAGMRFPYPIWSGTGRRVVVDAGVD